jgi:hypothetical protein
MKSHRPRAAAERLKNQRTARWFPAGGFFMRSWQVNDDAQKKFQPSHAIAIEIDAQKAA